MTEPLPVALAARVHALLVGGRRRLLGLTGPPGAGKSTLAARVVAHVGGSAAVCVPMDGFHLDQAVLERLGRADRKGAPDTIDAGGFVALLGRLRAGDQTVWAPEYHRDLHHGVAGAIEVDRQVRLVVVEGNYLLLERFGFAGVAPLLDECWYLAAEDGLRRDRLLARHVRFGKPPAAAAAWVSRSDEANARLVAPTAALADLVLTPPAADPMGDWTS